MVDHDCLPVSAHAVGKGHDSVGRGDDLRAVVASNIDTAVECALTVEWIDALTEAACHLAFYRPKVRSRVCFCPLGGGCVFCEAHREPHHRRTAQCRGPQSVELI